MSINVPNSKPGAALSVPNSSPGTPVSVPNSGPAQKAPVPRSTPAGQGGVGRHSPTITAKNETVSPGEVNLIPQNRRRYVGQRLGVMTWDGSIRELVAAQVQSAVVGGSRILDRTPWSGLEIVEM